VATVERGQRRIDVVEFLFFAEALALTRVMQLRSFGLRFVFSNSQGPLRHTIGLAERARLAVALELFAPLGHAVQLLSDG
jgi:hypothetical protein